MLQPRNRHLNTWEVNKKQIKKIPKLLVQRVIPFKYLLYRIMSNVKEEKYTLSKLAVKELFFKVKYVAIYLKNSSLLNIKLMHKIF